MRTAEDVPTRGGGGEKIHILFPLFSPPELFFPIIRLSKPDYTRVFNMYI